MNDDPNFDTSTATMAPPPGAPVKKKGGLGCWLWGCGSLGVIFLIIIGSLVAIALIFNGQVTDINKVVDRKYKEFREDHPSATVEQQGIVSQTGDSAQYVIKFREGAEGPQQQITTIYQKTETGMWLENTTTTTVGESIETTLGPDGEVITTSSSSDEGSKSDSAPDPVPVSPTPTP